jgi:hypothetical protein
MPLSSTTTGLPDPPPFRLQGFSPSWRLSPLRGSSACFVRLALMGFRPSEPFPPPQPCRLVGDLVPS